MVRFEGPTCITQTRFTETVGVPPAYRDLNVLARLLCRCCGGPGIHPTHADPDPSPNPKALPQAKTVTPRRAIFGKW